MYIGKDITGGKFKNKERDTCFDRTTREVQNGWKDFNATSSLNDKKKIIRQLLCTDRACVLRKAGSQIWATIITSSKHGLCLDHSRRRKLVQSRVNAQKGLWFIIRDRRRIPVDPVIRAGSGFIVATSRSGRRPGTNSLASKWEQDWHWDYPLGPWDDQQHKGEIARG